MLDNGFILVSCSTADIWSSENFTAPPADLFTRNEVGLRGVVPLNAAELFSMKKMAAEAAIIIFFSHCSTFIFK